MSLLPPPWPRCRSGAPRRRAGLGRDAASTLLAGGPAARRAVRLAFWTLIPQRVAKAASGRVGLAIKETFLAPRGAGTAPPGSGHGPEPPASVQTLLSQTAFNVQPLLNSG